MTEKSRYTQNPLEDLSFSNSVDYPNLYDPVDPPKLPNTLRTSPKTNHQNRDGSKPKEVVYSQDTVNAQKKALKNDQNYWSAFHNDDIRENRIIRNQHEIPNIHNFPTVKSHQGSSQKKKGVSFKDNETINPNHFYYEIAPLLNIYKKRVEKPVEPEIDVARKSIDCPQSLKSFEIIHDGALPLFTISSIALEETQFREEKDKGEYYENTEDQDIDREMKKIVLKKNPGIGSLINEGSKRIDKVRRMLDGHRRKTKSKSSYLFPEGLDALHISEIEGESTQREERESQERKSESRRVSKGGYERSTYDNGLEASERLARFGRFSFSSEEERREEKEKYGKEEKDVEFSLMEEPFVEGKEKNAEINEEDMDSFEDKRDNKRLNKIQREFVNARANALRDKTLIENNKQISSQSKSHHNENKEKRQVRQQGKENMPIAETRQETRTSTSKKNGNGFLSIDNSHQKHEHSSKPNEKASAGKNKGSYLKIFLEYKEKRKLKNQPPGNQSHRPTETPKKNYQSSRSSNMSAFTRETISERVSTRRFQESTGEDRRKRTRMAGNADMSTGIDSSDPNGFTDRSSAQGNMSTPNSKKIVQNDSSGKDKKEIEGKVTRPFDEKSTGKKEGKLRRNPIAEQIAKLQLSFGKDLKKEKVQEVLRQKCLSISQCPKNMGQESHNGRGLEESQRNGLFGASVNSRSLQMSYGPQDRSLKSSVLSYMEGNNSGLELKELLKSKGETRKNYQDILQTSPKFANRTVMEESSFGGNVRGQEIQESLAKSVRMRQEMWLRMNKRRQEAENNWEQKGEKASIYSKSKEWLESKQRKLDRMHTREIEEEMRECTFKPQLIAKELNLRSEELCTSKLQQKDVRN